MRRVSGCCSRRANCPPRPCSLRQSTLNSHVYDFALSRDSVIFQKNTRAVCLPCSRRSTGAPSCGRNDNVKLPGSYTAVGGRSTCSPGRGCLPLLCNSSSRVVGISMPFTMSAPWYPSMKSMRISDWRNTFSLLAGDIFSISSGRFNASRPVVAALSPRMMRMRPTETPKLAKSAPLLILFGVFTVSF